MLLKVSQDVFSKWLNRDGELCRPRSSRFDASDVTKSYITEEHPSPITSSPEPQICFLIPTFTNTKTNQSSNNQSSCLREIKANSRRVCVSFLTQRAQ
jgi:hypothetical protein